jgi:hypothetical protein
MASNIPEYISSEEDNEICSTQSQACFEKQRRKKRSRNWNFEEKFHHKQQADDFVNNENTWSYWYTNNSSDDQKVYYRCNKVKFRQTQCDAAIYLLFKNTCDDILLFRTEESHSCSKGDGQLNRLSTNAKTEIAKLFELNIKPRRILEKLRENGIPIKNKSQINNYLRKFRNEKYGQAKISLGQLEQWCLDHNTHAEDDDKAFIVGYEVKYQGDDDEDDDNENDSIDDNSFRVVISTHRLLKNMTNSDKRYKGASS